MIQVDVIKQHMTNLDEYLTAIVQLMMTIRSVASEERTNKIVSIRARLEKYFDQILESYSVTTDHFENGFPYTSSEELQRITKIIAVHYNRLSSTISGIQKEQKKYRKRKLIKEEIQYDEFLGQDVVMQVFEKLDSGYDHRADFHFDWLIIQRSNFENFLSNYNFSPSNAENGECESQNQTVSQRTRGALTYSHSLLVLELLTEQGIIPDWRFSHRELLAMIIGQKRPKDLYQKNSQSSILKKLLELTQGQKSHYKNLVQDVQSMFYSLDDSSLGIKNIRDKLDSIIDGMTN